jgi:hypothetical protein
VEVFFLSNSVDFISFGILPLEDLAIENFHKESQDKEVVFLTRLSVIISFGILPLEDLAIKKFIKNPQGAEVVIISFGILPLEDLAIRKIPLRIPRVWRSSVSASAFCR